MKERHDRVEKIRQPRHVVIDTAENELMDDEHSDDGDDEELGDLIKKIGLFLRGAERPESVKNETVRHGDRDGYYIRDEKLLTDDREGEVEPGEEKNIEDRQINERIQYTDSREAGGLRGGFIFH